MLKKISNYFAYSSVLIFVCVIVIAAIFGDYTLIHKEKYNSMNEAIKFLRYEVSRGELIMAGIRNRNKKLELRTMMKKQTGRYLVIDRHNSRFWVRETDKILYEGDCGVGMGQRQIRGADYNFETPSGWFSIEDKLEDPWWYRPNWFWYEKGIHVPRNFIRYPKGISFDKAVAYYNSLSKKDKLKVRAIPGYLGKYVIKITEGIYIHYSKNTTGQISHGCIRISNEDAKAIWHLLQIGDPVYIF